MVGKRKGKENNCWYVVHTSPFGLRGIDSDLIPNQMTSEQDHCQVRKIIVGMSGGIDSSMALWKLKEDGWNPVGVSLKLPVWSGKKRAGSNEKSLLRAKKVCEKLGVPHRVIDVRTDFSREVVDYFIGETRNLKTPNPCVICNRYLKFITLFDLADLMGVEKVATGHYARTRFDLRKGEYELLMAKDRGKDQSYYLSFLPQNFLERLVFPMGNFYKSEVYKMAKKIGIDYWKEKDQSQDFCFLGGSSLDKFLEVEFGNNTGPILDSQGKKLGEHRGLFFYTLGQRKGLGLSGGPYFVKGFDRGKNSLFVTTKASEVFGKEMVLEPFNFVSGDFPAGKIEVKARTRFRQRLTEATLVSLAGNKLKLVFKKRQKAVTPGQFAVFYKGEVCLGGGRIVSSH